MKKKVFLIVNLFFLIFLGGCATDPSQKNFGDQTISQSNTMSKNIGKEVNKKAMNQVGNKIIKGLF